jgi:hypothetical protein
MLIFWCPLIGIVLIKPNLALFDAWRHILFLVGPLIILSSIGLYAFIQSKKKYVVIIAIFLCAINIGITINTMVKLHPYEYIYFNSLVGGLKGAYRNYETDYWGASFKEATEWIYKNKVYYSSSDGNLYIYPCIDWLAKPYLKPNMIIDSTKATLQYCYTRWNEDKNLNGNIIHMVERESVPLNIITHVQ